MGPDVLKVRAVGQGVLRDNVHIAPIKFWVAFVFCGDKALTENHVGRAKSPRIGAAKEDCVPIHFRINIKRRREHVVPVPKAKKMAPLFVVRPVIQRGP